MQYLDHISNFITNNQFFLTALLFCGSYFLKRLADYFAGRTLIGTNTDDGVSALQVAGGGLRLVGGAAPSSPAEGTIYFNSTDKHFYG